MQLQSALSEAQSAREQQGALSAELDSLRTLVCLLCQAPGTDTKPIGLTGWSLQVSRSQQEVGELSSALQAASSDAESRAQAAAQAESRAAGLEAELQVSQEAFAAAATARQVAGHLGRGDALQAMCLLSDRDFSAASWHELTVFCILQAALGASQAGEQAVSKARSQADRHQEAVARLTGENLVLMLKLRQSEGAALQAASQRDAFARQLEQQKAPWFDQARPDRSSSL